MNKNKQKDQSIASLVRKYIESDNSLKKCMQLGIINVSSLSRIIYNELKKQGINSSIPSISSAIKRYKITNPMELYMPYKVIGSSNISLTTDVGKIVVNRRSLKTVTEKLSLISDDVIFFSKTVNTFTIVLSKSAFNHILNILNKNNERAIEIKTGLSLITIHSTKEIIETPGVINIIYQTLADNGINIEDTTSSYMDTLLLVSNKDAGKAFNVLNDLISKNQGLEDVAK
ncbi:MAG: ACT domain-containing protein [Thermoplasmatales archaeon]|jgi:Aspartokinases